MTWTQQSKGEWHRDTGTAFLRVVQVGWQRWHWSVTVDDQVVTCGSRATMRLAQRETQREAKAHALLTPTSVGSILRA